MYVPRTLSVRLGDELEAREIGEADLTRGELPLVILGEPGIGKSALTRHLADRLGAHWIPAGSFCRAADPRAVVSGHDGPLIIDGLDEVTVQARGAAIDQVLTGLSKLGNPPFVLACRAADWQASSGRHKIEQDYRVSPHVAHLQPLRRAESLALFSTLAPQADADAVFRQLDARGLDDFYGNPLTLELLARVVAAGGGLPAGKAALFRSACELLVTEVNRGHGEGALATTDVERLLDAAGAAFATLLLSSDVGVSTRPASRTPPGFAGLPSLSGLPDGELIPVVVGAALFRSDAEGLFTPVHRVVAEYLGARWLARRIAAGLSLRRVFGALTVHGGVPTALRGLHAWLAYFSAAAEDRCIEMDPYGVLRYGDTDQIPAPQAAKLLRRLRRLVADDPLFRADDWEPHAAHGLIRPELEPELREVLRGPGRSYHLTTLILEGLRGAAFAKALTRDLHRLVGAEAATYTERRRALEVLHENGDLGVPRRLLRRLRRADTQDSRNLAIDLIARVRGEELSDREIAGAYLQYEGLIGPSANPEADEASHQTVGVGLQLAERLPPERAAGVLDEMARQGAAAFRTAYWEIRFGVADATHWLLEAVARAGARVEAARFARWLPLLGEGQTFGRDTSDAMRAYVADPVWRREVQWRLLTDPRLADRPWTALLQILPRVKLDLAVTEADAAAHIARLARKRRLGAMETALWDGLMRLTYRRDGSTPALAEAAKASVARHPALAPAWAAFNAPPVRDYQAEALEAQAQREAKVEVEYEADRAEIRAHIDTIRTGQDWQRLYGPARVYLRQYTNRPRAERPPERVELWLGKDLGAAALEGLMAAVHHPDAPTAQTIIALGKEDKYHRLEPVLQAGVAERLRRGLGLADVPRETLEATLVAWWKDPHDRRHFVKQDVAAALEAIVIPTDAQAETLMRAVLEPRLDAGAPRLPLLDRLAEEPRWQALGARLGLVYLGRYPEMSADLQERWLRLVMRGPHQPGRQALVADRFRAAATPEARRFWTAAAIVSGDDALRAEIAAAVTADPTILWSVRELAEFREEVGGLTDGQLSFVIEVFGPHWPAVEESDAEWGRSSGWDASNFIVGCIRTLAGRPTAGAGAVLDHLVAAGASGHQTELEHARAAQARLRRDAVYAPPSAAVVVQVLSSGLPTSIDDLRALTVDALEAFQKRILAAETDGWRMFWERDAPLPEEICRDRLVELLNGRLPPEIQLLPEALMPHRKRADTAVLLGQMGLPIEVKGQWHSEVWHAGDTQLDRLYAMHWRAEGRGIYLVLWFGDCRGKQLRRHPDRLRAPRSAAELQTMLTERLRADQRGRLDVVVLDLDGRRPA